MERLESGVRGPGSGWRLSYLFLSLFLLLPSPARAGHDVKRTIDFLGFSGDGQRYLLKVSDADFGDQVSVRAFATGRQEAAIPIRERKDEKKVVEDARRRYQVTDRGADAQQSPDGLYTILGIPRDDGFQLNLMKGDRQARFKTIPVAAGAAPTKVTMKSVFWTKDGRKIVVIVHKKRVEENGVDADEAHPFEFRTGGLNFK